ncbi:hypothetical protein [Qipengyuania sp.]|uniref:hypothetical protein n=1 Tax=Qipengyuania sp. TaxID=2004515 RepID=UPI003519D50D
MPTYKLVFEDDGLGQPKTMEFEGQTAAHALSLLESERDARNVKLWTGGELLANLIKDRNRVWQVSASEREVAEDA